MAHRRPLNQNACETVFGELLDPVTLMSAVEGCDVVLHMAALTHSPDESKYFKINHEGTQNLISACVEKGVKRLVFVSTRSAQADGGSYALSKLNAEEAVKKSGLQWIILQPAECFGPGSKDFINRLANWVRKWPVIPCIGGKNCKLSPVHVDDAVAGIVSSLKIEGIINKTFVLAGPETMTIEELIDRLCLFFKIKKGKVNLPLSMISLFAQISSRMGMNIIMPDQIPRLACKKPDYDAKSGAELGFTPRKLEEGLKNMF